MMTDTEIRLKGLEVLASTLATLKQSWLLP